MGLGRSHILGTVFVLIHLSGYGAWAEWEPQIFRHLEDGEPQKISMENPYEDESKKTFRICPSHYIRQFPQSHPIHTKYFAIIGGSPYSFFYDVNAQRTRSCELPDGQTSCRTIVAEGDEVFCLNGQTAGDPEILLEEETGPPGTTTGGEILIPNVQVPEIKLVPDYQNDLLVQLGKTDPRVFDLYAKPYSQKFFEIRSWLFSHVFGPSFEPNDQAKQSHNQFLSCLKDNVGFVRFSTFVSLGLEEITQNMKISSRDNWGGILPETCEGWKKSRQAEEPRQECSHASLCEAFHLRKGRFTVAQWQFLKDLVNPAKLFSAIYGSGQFYLETPNPLVVVEDRRYKSRLWDRMFGEDQVIIKKAHSPIYGIMKAECGPEVDPMYCLNVSGNDINQRYFKGSFLKTMEFFQ